MVSETGRAAEPATVVTDPELPLVPDLLEVAEDAIAEVSRDDPGGGKVDLQVDVPLLDVQLRIGF